MKGFLQKRSIFYVLMKCLIKIFSVTIFMKYAFVLRSSVVFQAGTISDKKYQFNQFEYQVYIFELCFSIIVSSY